MPVVRKKTLLVSFPLQAAKLLASLAKKHGVSAQFLIRAATYSALRENGFSVENFANPRGQGDGGGRPDKRKPRAKK